MHIFESPWVCSKILVALPVSTILLGAPHLITPAPVAVHEPKVDALARQIQANGSPCTKSGNFKLDFTFETSNENCISITLSSNCRQSQYSHAESLQTRIYGYTCIIINSYNSTYVFTLLTYMCIIWYHIYIQYVTISLSLAPSNVPVCNYVNRILKLYVYMWGMRVFAWYCNICKTCAYGIWCVKVKLWGHQSTTWTCLHSMRSIQGTVSNWQPRERRLWIIAHHSPPYSNTRTPAIQCYCYTMPA